MSPGSAVKVSLFAPDGSLAASGAIALPKFTGSVTSAINLTVVQPALWSPDSPALYRAVAELAATRMYEDASKLESNFGFRTISFDAKDGFKLNGVTTKLYGGCLHHDNGPLGSKAIGRVSCCSCPS